MTEPEARATCNICGEEMSPDPQEMVEHMILNHPLQLLQSPKVRKGIAAVAEDLGTRFANFLKGLGK